LDKILEDGMGSERSSNNDRIGSHQFK